MSDYWEIFARTSQPLEEIVREVEELMNIQTRRVTDDLRVRYDFTNENVDVTISGHDFENDRDANFEDYQYCISMRALRGNPPEEYDERRKTFARRAFERLSATGRYGLMMTSNLQTVLARYEPGEPGSGTMAGSRPAEWSEETERRMRKAGWYPGRDVSELVEKWKRKLSRPGRFYMFAAAERALREFGGIRVEVEGPGLECARSGFRINPMLAGWELDRFSAYEERIGVRIFPLGLAVGGSCFLTIGEDGRVFLSVEDVWPLGDSLADALDALIVGRKPGAKV